MSARDGWNAAQRAAERELKKPRKMHGPVGLSNSVFSKQVGTNDGVCPKCHYHLCTDTCPTLRGKPMCLTTEQLHAHRVDYQFNEPKFEPEPKTELTLAEAEAACRAGKIVRKIRDSAGDAPIHEVWLRYVGQFEQLWPNRAYGTDGWVKSMQFPYYSRLTAGECAVMRFEVVE